MQADNYSDVNLCPVSHQHSSRPFGRVIPYSASRRKKQYIALKNKRTKADTNNLVLKYRNNLILSVFLLLNR